MIRKITLLALAAGALVAFAAPAAQAANTLTDSSGTLQPSAEFTATSTNLTTTFPSGAVWSCPGALGGKVTLHLEVLSNHPLVIRQVGEATAMNCFLFAPEARGIQVTDGTISGNLTFEESNEASAVLYFGADISESGQCEFEGAITAIATTGTSTIDVSPSTLEGFGPEGCVGGTIEGSFELETSSGDPVTID